MRSRHFFYAGGTLLAALIIAVSAWQPPARADKGGVNKNKPPAFEVDASWPKPLPAPVGADGLAHTWVQGEVAGSCIDQNDNVYTFNRGWEVGATYNGVLQGNQSGAINGNDATPTAIPSPPVVVFDSDGNTITGWGNPSLYLTPTTGTTPADTGYASYLPHGAHGCYVDYQGNIWVGGNGDGIVQKYNPNIAAAQGAGATYEMQIGQKGVCDGPQTTTNPFSSCGSTVTGSTTSDFNTSHTLLNEPPDMAVDPNVGPVSGTKGDIYIADGYGNHRIVVFNAAGQYVGQWGQTCTIAGVPSNSQSCPPGTFGATGGGHPHCVVLGNDGLVYVCDRPNSRIQVFSKTCAKPSVPGTGLAGQPLCAPVRIINIGNNGATSVSSSGFPTATPANSAAILSLGTRSCDMDFWPNIDYLASASPTSQDVIVNVDLANDNTWLLKKATGLVFGALGACGIAPCPGHNAGHFAYGHTTAVDSEGNIYVAETITGRRIQKFVQVKGKGNDDD